MKSYPASGSVTLRTNLADSALCKPLKSGAIASSLVTFDFAGPKVALDAFKAMVRDIAYDAGELAIFLGICVLLIAMQIYVRVRRRTRAPKPSLDAAATE